MKMKLTKNTENFDAIIVLGRQFPIELISRLRKGEELYEEHKSMVVFSGGLHGFYNEAEYMEKETTIPKKDIVLEKKSKNTIQNAVLCKKIILDNNFKKIIIVTSPYHVFRAFVIFKNVLPLDVYVRMEKTDERYSFKRNLFLFFQEFWRLFHNLYQINFKYRK